MVARDGVEPPTPAFSGLDTASLICLIPFVFTLVFITSSAHLLEQFGTALEQLS
jgi:hypothetical protein